MHVLLIEDDLELGRALQAALKVHNIASEWIRRIADAPFVPDGEVVSCVLLDLSLPDGRGNALLARWRQAGCTVPVIVITAQTALSERLSCLDGGADDFVMKPFAFEELVSRLRAVTRRGAGQAANRLAVGDLTIDLTSRAVFIDGKFLELSAREFQLLSELARQPGNAVAKSRLSRRMTPLGEPMDVATLEVHVSNLRKKIGAEHIRTVRGVGYMLVP